jgi:DNA adenine methylase
MAQDVFWLMNSTTKMSDKNSSLTSAAARPVLKWVGGKNQLLPELLKRIPPTFESYHEPFLGGGALFFALASSGRIKKAFLSDRNQTLMDVYFGLKNHPAKVIAALKEHIHEKDYYYSIRSLNPNKLSLAQRAARIIYLNKTCYNGLFRENKSGQFNVPFGSYKNPTICDEINLLAASIVLKSTNLSCHSYEEILLRALPGDFVYFDPPYQPVSKTANFTAYEKNGFKEEDQEHLADIFKKLHKKNVSVLLSNSDVPFIRNLYKKDFTIEKVWANRAINSCALKRGKVAEVLIRSYP